MLSYTSRLVVVWAEVYNSRVFVQYSLVYIYKYFVIKEISGQGILVVMVLLKVGSALDTQRRTIMLYIYEHD